MNESGTSASPWRIRPAVSSDAQRLCDFRRLVLSETEFLLQGPEDWRDDVADERDLIERFNADPLSVLLLACQNRAVVGMCSVVAGPLARNRHVGQVGVAVLKAYWRLGVARALILAALRWSAESGGLHKMALQVHRNNRGARRLYEDLAFKYEGVLRDEARWQGQYVDLLAMGRLLGSGVAAEESSTHEL